MEVPGMKVEEILEVDANGATTSADKIYE